MELKFIFLAFLAIKLATQYALARRQARHVLTHRGQVPEAFASKISLAEHQKAADYTLAKLGLGKIERLVGTLLLLAWTLGGGLEWAHGQVFSWGPITQGLGLFAMIGLVDFFIGLPFSWVLHFKIEERFGMNRRTLKTFLMDTLKQVLLGILLGGPLLAGILWVVISAGANWWFWAFAFLASVQLILMWAYPALIAPLFNKFSPLPEGEVKERIEGLLKRLNLDCKGLFVMDASKRTAHGNAYFTGLGRKKRIVFFDTLINSLAPKELEAVMAHELGHFVKKHILKGLGLSFFSSLVGFFVLGNILTWPPFYLTHGVSSMSPGLGLALASMVGGTYTFFLTPLMAFWSRRHEFEADAFAAKHAEAALLIEALVKLYKENFSTLTPDPIYSSFYDSHPPAPVRIAHLKKISS